MTVQQPVRPSPRTELTDVAGSALTVNASRALAVLRIATGFIFLWAFLDKTFGLHYATPTAKAWINGGSPTKGFLSSVDVGPFQSTFHSIAGTWYANGLFMLGLLAIGVALISGVAVRIAAGAGILLVAMMWFATFPLAQHTSTGAPSGSNNPLVDDHFLEAAVLLVLALTYAGRTWGLGRIWARLPFVRQHSWTL